MNVDFDKFPEFTREPADFYHSQATNYLSSHQLIDYMESPRLYFRKFCGAAKRSSSAAFELGRAVHSLVLEGRDAFDAEFATTDGAPRNPTSGEIYGATSKAYKEWAAKESRTILPPSQVDLVEASRQSVASCRRASELLTNGVAELVGRAEYCGLRCQIRCDWIRRDGILIDYKTCDRLDYFESDARRYRYFNQAAFYRAVVERIVGERFGFYFIATEKREPFATGVFPVVGLDRAQAENERAIERLKRSWDEMYWPTGWEEERVLSYDG
ncbi:MAG: PD-(D/E)XK nuclease-like domain-containing protein [Thermoguttaceae bacterium]|nr:PD-(D/E)XK nuclease-like domain-containing protein [Thermoguttaceae bacterium]